MALPTGCSFHPRCDFRSVVGGDACATTMPELTPAPGESTRLTRCHLLDPRGVLNEEIQP